MPADLQAELEKKGHVIKKRDRIGSANSIEVDPKTGEIHAVADTTRGGGKAVADQRRRFASTDARCSEPTPRASFTETGGGSCSRGCPSRHSRSCSPSQRSPTQRRPSAPFPRWGCSSQARLVSILKRNPSPRLEEGSLEVDERGAIDFGGRRIAEPGDVEAGFVVPGRRAARVAPARGRTTSSRDSVP